MPFLEGSPEHTPEQFKEESSGSHGGPESIVQGPVPQSVRVIWSRIESPYNVLK